MLQRVLGISHRGVFLSGTFQILFLRNTCSSIVIFLLSEKVILDSHLPKPGDKRFCLELEERVMQLLIINIHLPHFRLNSLSRLRFQTHPRLLLLYGVPHRRNPRISDVTRQLERRFLDTSLSLQIISLSTPMCRYWDGVPI